MQRHVFDVLWMLSDQDNSPVLQILNLGILSINRLTWCNLLVSWPLSLWGVLAQYEEFMSGAEALYYPQAPYSRRTQKHRNKWLGWRELRGEFRLVFIRGDGTVFFIIITLGCGPGLAYTYLFWMISSPPQFSSYHEDEDHNGNDDDDDTDYEYNDDNMILLIAIRMWHPSLQALCSQDISIFHFYGIGISLEKMFCQKCLKIGLEISWLR